MAQFTKNSKRNPLERHSSQGLVLGCPICAAKLDLLDTRDGDQAYWCHRCQSGWRVGNLPEAAHRHKDSAAPEPQVEAVPAAAEARVVPKTRGAKNAVDLEGQQQLAALAPLTRLRRHRTQGEAEKRSRRVPTEIAARVEAINSPRAKPPVAQIVTPKRGASPRAVDVTVRTPKTAAPKKATQKPSLETSLTGSRRAARVAAPISKPVKVKRQPLEVAAKPRRATPQKSQKKALEIAVSAPQPKRLTRPPLETAAPIKALLPRAKRAQPEQPALRIKSSRTSAAPIPKAITGKRQWLEVVTAPRVSAEKARKKTLETAAPIKAPAKPLRREQPVFETGGGSRKAGQLAAPSPRAATGKRQPLEVAAKPKISAARAAAPEPLKRTPLTVAPIKAPAKLSRREKLVLEPVAAPKTIAPRAAAQKPPKKTLETVSVSGKKARQAILESTPKPRRSSLRAAEALKPARVAPREQRKAQNAPIHKVQNAPIRKAQNAPVTKAQTAPVKQPRAQRQTTTLEQSKSRTAPRVAAKPSPAPVKSLKPALTKPEPTRAARVTKQPVAVAPRPKPARSSPARPAPVAPSSPVQFGLFDGLPPKTAGRKQR